MAAIDGALSANVNIAETVAPLFDCDASAAVGDLVYQDTTTDKKVLVFSNNTNTQQWIGVIKEKPSSTTCNVLLIGLQDGYSGLTRGGAVFISPLGVPTTVRPTTSGQYLHRIGVATSATEVLFLPNNIRTLLV